ncbi:MAG: glucose-6-phosphate isomerase, partial [Cellulomonadaceae bacterium]|nr:glucose-6-phosphate isomerase [Cellulomonadaceae bacterium]
MTVPSPIDPQSTAAWASLENHYGNFQADLRGWFTSDPARAERLSYQAGDLFVDLSKNLVTDEILGDLARLAYEVNLPERINAMFSGEKINCTEGRSVLHTALRRGPLKDIADSDRLHVDGQDIDADVEAVLVEVGKFADKVRKGTW